MQQFEKEYTNKLPKKQFRRLNTKVTVQLNTSIAIEPHCLAVTVEHTVSSKSCHGAWTSAPLSAHPFHQVQMHSTSNRDAHLYPFAQQLISSSNNIRVVHWADHQWIAEWADSSTRLRNFIPDTGTHPPRMTLPRRAWVWPLHQCWVFLLVLVQMGHGLLCGL